MARSLVALLFLPLITAHGLQKPLTSNSLPITGFVALGDSYSAGIGTPPHPSPTNKDCRLGLSAYPHLLALDLLPPNSSTFQWLSCTGSTTTDLLSSPLSNTSQIDLISLSPSFPSFATLSIGGNDASFFPVLNACIFRFYGLSSGSCDAALNASREIIDSPEFGYRIALVISEILNKVRWEKHPEFRVTVTGYARFFVEETEECEKRSMGVWWGDGQKLTKEVRGRINRLVEGVNRRVKGVVERFGERVVWVDVDGAWEGHRFCEPGVEEPEYARDETWFFLPGGGDTNSTEGDGEDGMGEMDPGTVEEGCLERAGGDWGLMALCYMAMAKRRDPTLRLKGDLVWEESMWYVPTYYGKVFHPRSRGHEAIRDRIYQVWKGLGIKIQPSKEVSGPER